MKFNFDKLPLILPEEIIRELLIIYDNARQSSEWRKVSSKLSDEQVWQVLHAVIERDEKNAHEEWLHSSQEEKDTRVRTSQSFYWNRVHDGSFFEDEGKYTESTLEKRFKGDPLIEITRFRNAYLKNEVGKFYFFSTEDSPFSMCYPSAILVSANNFHSAVQYVMYQKAELFLDRASMKRILEAASPREAFGLGREVMFFNRKVWQGNLGDIMRHTLREVNNDNTYTCTPYLSFLILLSHDHVISCHAAGDGRKLRELDAKTLFASGEGSVISPISGWDERIFFYVNEFKKGATFCVDINNGNVIRKIDFGTWIILSGNYLYGASIDAVRKLDPVSFEVEDIKIADMGRDMDLAFAWKSRSMHDRTGYMY
jgi:hypothetical protein